MHTPLTPDEERMVRRVRSSFLAMALTFLFVIGAFVAGIGLLEYLV